MNRIPTPRVFWAGWTGEVASLVTIRAEDELALAVALRKEFGPIRAEVALAIAFALWRGASLVSWPIPDVGTLKAGGES